MLLHRSNSVRVRPQLDNDGFGEDGEEVVELMAAKLTEDSRNEPKSPD